MITNWVAPCKPAPSDYFVAIFQVAPNRLKFGMSTLFVLKNVPVFFIKNADKICGKNCVKFNTPPPSPPPPSPSVSKQCRISIFEAKTLCMCLLRYWREIGEALQLAIGFQYQSAKKLFSLGWRGSVERCEQDPSRQLTVGRRPLKRPENTNKTTVEWWWSEWFI